METEKPNIDTKDFEIFKRGIMGVIDTFRKQEFGETREFAFNGLKGAVNMMVDSLARGDIKKTVIFTDNKKVK